MKTVVFAAAALAAMTMGGTAFAARGGGGDLSINERQAIIAQRIDHGHRVGALTHREARSLRRDLHQIERMEWRFRRDGLSYWERRELNRHLDALSARVRFERHDRQDRPRYR